MDDGMNERKLVSVVILVGHPVVTMMQSGKCKIDSVVVVVDSAVAPGTGERVLVLLITRLRLLHQGGILLLLLLLLLDDARARVISLGANFSPLCILVAQCNRFTTICIIISSHI